MSTPRVKSVSVGKYDQVIALTQWLINKGIEGQYTKVHLQREKDLLATSTRRDGSGITQLKFGPPTVIVDASPGNFSMVLYRLHLRSGTLNMYASEDPDDPRKIRYQIKDWYFAFPVNIGLVGVDETSQKYKEMRAKMNVPGDYSISQLLIDLTTAQVNFPNMKFSSFGTWAADDVYIEEDGNETHPPNYVEGQRRDWEKEPEHVRAQFEKFLQDCTKSMLKAQLNDMGCVATKKDVTQPARVPTFLPTDVRFQTYPWTDPQNPSYTPVAGMDGNSRFNYLCYLEMTDGANPPSSASTDAFLQPGMGCWTDGRDPFMEHPSKFGTFKLSSRKFLDKFLLPKLAPLNALMRTDIHKPTCSIEAFFSSVEWNFNISLDIGSGWQSATEKDFGFVSTKFGNPVDQLLLKNTGDWTGVLQAFGVATMPTLPSNALTWFYTFVDTPESAHDEDKSQVLYNAYIDANCNTFTVARLSIIPGSNQVILDGRAWVTTGFRIDPGWADSNIYQSLTAQAKWQVVLEMQECSDGGLSILPRVNRPQIDFFGDYGRIQHAKSYIERSFDLAADNLESKVADLKNALQGKEKFFFPSNGVFVFKNPIFDFEGNLVTEVAYTPDEGLFPNSQAAPRDTSAPPPIKAMLGNLSLAESGKPSK